MAAITLAGSISENGPTAMAQVRVSQVNASSKFVRNG
jgi:hypothetical protein